MANKEIYKKSKEVKETYKELALKFKNTKSDLAFSKLYQKMYPSMFNYVFGMIKDYDEACDIIANSMYNVYTKIDQYNPQYQITTWAFKIAYHETIRVIRDKNQKIQLSKGLDISDNGESSTKLRDLKSEINGFNNIDFFDIHKDEETFLEEDEELIESYNLMINEIKNLKSIYKDIMIDRLINGLSYMDIVKKHNIPFIEDYEKLDKEVKKLKVEYVDDMKNDEKKKKFYSAVERKNSFRKKFMITEQTVKNRLLRGKKILMEKFKDDEKFKIYNKNILKDV